MPQTINKEFLWDNFSKLNENQQSQIIEYIKKLNHSHSKKQLEKQNQEQSFIGMWSDIENFKDSSKWVKDLREKEWSIK